MRNYTTARAIQLTGTGSIDGFMGNDATPGSPSILPVAVNSFDNMDILIGSGASDTLRGPNLRTHWDLAGNNGVLVADESDLSLTGNASRIGRPTGTVPISAGPGERDLAYTGFESLAGGSNDDWFDLRDGVSLSGSIDGGGQGLQGDSLDYRDFTAIAVTVDLDTGVATRIGGGTGGLVTRGDRGAASRTCSAAVATIKISGDADHNILGDGFGSDVLHGGSGGNDTFRLEPGQGPAATITSSTRAATRATRSTSASPRGGGHGVSSTWTCWPGTRTATSRRASQPTRPICPSRKTCSAAISCRWSRWAPPSSSRPPARSKTWWGANTTTCCSSIRCETIRSVDGNAGRDLLDFDGGGSEVTDTGRSLTAAGIGSVVYDGVEWVETSDAQSRILDNDDYGYSQTGWWDRSRSEGYLGDERFSNSGTGANVARWTAEGVTPGWYRVAATWVPGPNRATNAQFRVSYLDDVTGTKSPATTMLADGTAPNGIAPLNQRVLPASYAEDGTYWQELGDALDPQQALYFWIPDNSHTLVVELPDTGNAFVMADGVRLERLNGADLQTDLGFVPPPSYDFAREAEIRVVSQSDGRSLADGLGVEDFGLTDSHGSVVRTYAVQNTGLADLTVSVLNTVTQPVPDGLHGHAQYEHDRPGRHGHVDGDAPVGHGGHVRRGAVPGNERPR